jgi:hypothetical protein
MVQDQTQKSACLLAPTFPTGVRKQVGLTTLPVVLQPSAGPMFETVEDHHLFGIFLDSTCHALSGAFDTSLWKYLLPQHSANEPFARYGMAALGCMTLTFMESISDRMAGRSSVDDSCLSSSRHYPKAISLYAQSLQHMRRALFRPDHNIRHALLACLIVVCFEGFHGHTYATAMHALNGLDLFHSWRDRQLVIKPDALPFRSPNPAELEDDIVATMYRLDLQVLSFFDSRSSTKHTSLATYNSKTLKYMPSAFLSLSQARMFWDVIYGRTCHFIVSVLGTTGSMSTALFLDGPTMPYPKDLDVPTGVRLFAQGVNIPTGYERERTDYKFDIEAWEQAYGPIYKQLKLANTTQQARGATILLIQSKMTQILLESVFFESEMEYDNFLPVFRSIFDLAASIWNSHVILYSVGVSYNFELGLLPPLFLVMTRCRDRDLRHQVMDLLLSSFHRENYWDSLSVAFIGRWVTDMEKTAPQSLPAPVKGCETQVATAFPRAESVPLLMKTRYNVKAGAPYRKVLSKEFTPVVVPEETRVRITRFNVDLNLRLVQLEYVQGPVTRRDGRIPEVKESVVCW